MKLEEQLGKRVSLPVFRQVDFGVYLGTQEAQVLLPQKQVPEGCSVGDLVSVFLYRDSEDRLIATTQTPKILLGQLKVLTVVEVGKIGAFLDWGLEKDLLLPFREQTQKVQKGQHILVSLYVDKSDRLCATMRVYDLLSCESPYQEGDQVDGIIYEKREGMGVFVAVDDCFSAMIPQREAYGDLQVGNRIHGRVIRVRTDGKLDLSVRKKAYLQLDDDAAMILDQLQKRGGFLPFTDQADPALIKQELGLSKKAMKRAVGKLLKEQKIVLTKDQIVLNEQEP